MADPHPFRLTLLGTGTCSPNSFRLPSAYWVDLFAADGAKLALRLDCGPGTVHSTPGYNIDWATQTHQVISHFHQDHTGDLPTLMMAFKFGRKNPADRGPLRIIGPAGVEAQVRKVLGAFPLDLAEQPFPLEFVELDAGDATPLAEGVSLTCAKTPHSPESLAYRIDGPGGSLGYTGDTSSGEGFRELGDFFAGVDVLVAECAHLDETPGSSPHLNAGECAELADRAGAKKLIAVHCYFQPEHSRLIDRLRSRFGGSVHVGHDGETFAVGG
jgi:ribonuclease BN (tRNA processing enzyme)